jgi:chromate transporter
MVEDPPLARPRSLGHLFWAFSVLALQGFGGVIAIAQRELCERRRWLRPEEFVTLLGTAQVLPGPNVCNLSLMIGDRFFGWRGACAALGGMVCAPLALMLLIAWLLGLIAQDSAWQHHLQGAVGGIAAVAAGQIVGTGLKLAASLRQHVLGWPTCAGIAALALGMMTWLHWPLLWMLGALAPLACVAAYWALGRAAPAKAPTS